MSTIDIAQIRRLSVDERVHLLAEIWKSIGVDERIALAQAIWESVAAENPPPRMNEEETTEITRRIAEHVRNPSSAIPWDNALARLRERYG